MFNIGAGEMILIALVLLIAVGPEQLPGVIRRTGRVVGQLKTMSDNLRRDFNASLDEIERAADVKSWAGAELETTVESVKEATTDPFKTDLGVDGSTKVTDLWSRPPAEEEVVAEEETAMGADDEADLESETATEPEPDVVDDMNVDAASDTSAADGDATPELGTVDPGAADEVA